MILVLLVTCIETPLDLAFSSVENNWTVRDTFSMLIDFMFLIDIVIIFNTAFFNGKLDLIDSRKGVALNYIKGWFIIDLLAILPFDLILKT